MAVDIIADQEADDAIGTSSSKPPPPERSRAYQDSPTIWRMSTHNQSMSTNHYNYSSSHKAGLSSALPLLSLGIMVHPLRLVMES